MLEPCIAELCIEALAFPPGPIVLHGAMEAAVDACDAWLRPMVDGRRLRAGLHAAVRDASHRGLVDQLRFIHAHASGEWKERAGALEIVRAIEDADQGKEKPGREFYCDSCGSRRDRHPIRRNLCWNCATDEECQEENR